MNIYKDNQSRHSKALQNTLHTPSRKSKNMAHTTEQQ